MKIARKAFSVGAALRYVVDYGYWLQEGRTLSPTTGACTAVLIADPDIPGSSVPTDVTVNQIQVTADKLYFFVTGGSVNETFTVQVQATDTLGEIIIDTVEFVVLPV
jgi:hypothetical protein